MSNPKNNENRLLHSALRTQQLRPPIPPRPSPLTRGAAAPKAGLHPRNRHRAGYDFAQLTHNSPALRPFVVVNPYGTPSIDFANPAAVKALNQALLKSCYGLADWDIPAGYLCPPIPGRADYIHHLADLLAASMQSRAKSRESRARPNSEHPFQSRDLGGFPRRSGSQLSTLDSRLHHSGLADGQSSTPPHGPATALLDIGTGANGIYPILGVHEYGWRFVSTELDPVACRHAQQFIAATPSLSGLVDCRRQLSATAIFKNVLKPGETFAASLCNPPFHTSAEAAATGTQRKLRNLTGKRTATAVLNFGGQHTELWCAGGELAFIQRMITESAQIPHTCRWFTTLVSKAEHLPALQLALTRARAATTRIIPMAQGQKQSRILAWSFLPSA